MDRRSELVIRLVTREFDPRRIRIQISGRMLTFTAAAAGSGAPPSYRAFERSIVLPEAVRPETCSARAGGHVLTVRFQKAHPSPTEHPSDRGSETLKVRDVMTRVVRFVTPETPVSEAAGLLRTYDFGSVPVCTGGMVVGILTDRDIAVRVTAPTLDPTLVRVGDVMTPDPVTCSPDDALAEAEREMADAQVRRLPVVDPQGYLVGFLSMARIARSEAEGRAGQLLRGVSQPGTPALGRPPADR
jgi:CBS domain-containing protein